MDIKYIFLFVSSLVHSMSSYAETVPLSKMEQEKIIGGTFTSIASLEPNQRLGSDEIIIRGLFARLTLNDAPVRISHQFGNGKASFQTVTMARPEDGASRVEGEFTFSAIYPLQEDPSPYILRLCDSDENSQFTPCSEVPLLLTPTVEDGNIGIQNIDINRSLKIYGIRFHRVRDGNQAAFVDSEKLTELADSIFESGTTYLANKPMSIDDIYGQ